MSEMIVSPVVIVDTSSSNPDVVNEAPAIGVSFTTQVV
jgi:hypothetical protein